MAHGAGEQNHNTTVPKLKTILVGSIVVDSPLRKRGDTPIGLTGGLCRDFVGMAFKTCCENMGWNGPIRQ